MKAPALFRKTLTCAGVLFLSIVSFAQSAKPVESLMSFQLGGTVPTQSFQQKLNLPALTDSSVSISEAMVDPNDTLGNPVLGTGAGFTAGFSYLRNLNKAVTWSIGLNYSMQNLRHFNDAVEAGTIRIQTPTIQANLIWNPLRETGQHLLIYGGISAGVNLMQENNLYTRNDTILSIPFIGALVNKAELNLEVAETVYLDARAGITWVNEIKPGLSALFTAEYSLPLLDQYRFAGEITEVNLIIPVTTSLNTASFNLQRLNVSAGIAIQLGKKKQ
jgi:hypothetical protein